VTVRIIPGRRIDGIAFSRAVNGGPDGNECCLPFLGGGYEEESFEPAAPAIYRWIVLAFLFLKDRLTRLVKENNLYDYKYGQPAIHRFRTKGHHPAGHELADGGKLSVWLAGGYCRRFELLLSEAFVGISRPVKSLSTAAHLASTQKGVKL
jgi:hypothetical protein